MAEQALAVARASVRAVLGHVLGDSRIECQLLFVTVIVVDGDEPVAGLHVFGDLTADRRLLGNEIYSWQIVSTGVRCIVVVITLFLLFN